MDKNVDNELINQNTSNKNHENIISTSNTNNAKNINDNSPEQNVANIQNLNNIINPESIPNSSPNSCPGKVILISNHTKSNNYNDNNKSNKDLAHNKILNNPNSKLLQEKLKNIFLEREKAKLKYNKQLIPEQLKYNSDDEESNYSKEIKKNDLNDKINKVEIKQNSNEKHHFNHDKIIQNEKEEKKENEINNSSNEKEKNINSEKIRSIKKDNREINEIKSFTKNRYNNSNKNINNEKDAEEENDRNLYQLLLSKKVKDMYGDVKEENKNNSKKEDIKEKKEILRENLIEKEEKKAEKEFKKEEIENTKENEETIQKEAKIEKTEEKEKENELIKNNKEDKEIVENRYNKSENIDKNKNNEEESNNEEEKKKYQTKTLKRSSGVITLNQNINIEKDNQNERNEKCTEVPSLQRNKLTINLNSPRILDKIAYNNNETEYQLKSPIISSREAIIINENPKTINRYEHESKTVKEEPNDKNSILKLLRLIKNKKSEKEKIEKEKEKVKEGICQRSKSQAPTRNLESFHKLKSKSIEENKQLNNNINNNENCKNKRFCLGSPKQEIYNKKTMTNNRNKIASNHPTNFNSKNIKKIEIQKNNNSNLIKKNNECCSSNKNNMNRIVVNHRMKKTITKKGFHNLKSININGFKNSETYKTVISRHNTTNITKANQKIKRNEIEINCKKTYEKPVFIYNKQNLPNRSMEMDNLDFSNSNYLSNNNIFKYSSSSSNKIIRNILIPKKIYNPRKPVNGKGKSVEKSPRQKNIINKDYGDFYSYNNYNNNLNNYNCNNNSDINASPNSNNIYVKKKSFLIESNFDTNTSSIDISKSKNGERSQKYYSINNYKLDNSGINSGYPSYYMMLSKKEKDNSYKKINLKVNKKMPYNHYYNETESGEIEYGLGRSLILDQNNNFNYNKNSHNVKNLDKHNSFNINKKNTSIRGYKNANKKSPNYKKSVIKKDTSKTSKDIFINFETEENKSINMNTFNNNSIIKTVNNDSMFNKRRNGDQKKLSLFKIEDLLVIEEKLNFIIECLRNNQETKKQCFDFWNYFFNGLIFKKIEKIYDAENDIEIIKLSINYLLISLIICYEYCTDQDAFIETNSKLLELMEINYNNLMKMFQQIINYVDDEVENPWIKRLLNVFEAFSKREEFSSYNEDILFTIEKIRINNENINLKIQNILNSFQTENSTLLTNYYLQIKVKTYEDLNLFFQNSILQIENEEGSLIACLYLRNNSLFSPMPPPYIKKPNPKKYTLVLDLDETLVNFKIKKGREGYVRLRPFLFGFLEEVSQSYELIIFTSSTEAYANSVIEAIEHDKKYFDYVFYRQHTIIVGNDFVKDLTRIGRPLNSTIIIDNTPQNFRFQKENGISIKPFWGQDSNDKTLYDLMPILLDIAQIGGDVRITLGKYREEIIGKITSNVSKNKY